MQCKDIPDEPILQYLAKAGQWVMRWRNPGWPCILDAMPADVPEKLALAKMAQLINRGLVAGCTCGCRGDFELTEKGWDHVEGKCPYCHGTFKEMRGNICAPCRCLAVVDGPKEMI